MTETDSDSGWGTPLARSPSLRDRSSGTMACIAARVVKEIAHDSNVTRYYHRNGVVCISPATSSRNDAFQEDSGSEFEFDFAIPGVGEYSSPISADDIFQNGQIKPLLPLLNSNSVHTDINCSPLPQSSSSTAEIIPVRRPLKNLMITERQTESVSSSSSEPGDLEGVAPEMYCVWTPNKHGIRKKIQSTGSSKRWKFLDLLYRSHREGGGDALEFSTTKSEDDQKRDLVKERKTMKKKANGESVRKISYLIGWFANMNGLSRMVQPF